MLSVFLWYLLISLTGWLSFPLAYRLLPALKDRGYTISRVLGYLLWGYAFWLLASLGILRNETGSLLFCLGLLITLSMLALRSIDLAELRSFFTHQRRMIWVSEILFLLSFVGWAAVRAANPEAVGTEKPMELAFINAILNSAEFPPHDPWLSGYAISYYHFGYILVAMLAKISATPGAVAFNLGAALIFALSALAAYGLLYNLLGAWRSKEQEPSQGQAPGCNALPALVAPLFLLIVSNLEGFLSVLHTRGFFWKRELDGILTSRFWQWLDIKDLSQPPEQPFSWIPTRFWWWWRASRVVQDYDLAGNPKEIIDEFPFFSYLLADLHPHLLVMPFALLALSLALNIFLDHKQPRIDWLRGWINYRSLIWSATLAIPAGILLLNVGLTGLNLKLVSLALLCLVFAGFVFVALRKTLVEHGLELLIRKDIGTIPVELRLFINPLNFLLAALVLGGIAFLNTWDFPFFLSFFAAAYAANRLISEKKPIYRGLLDFLSLALPLGILSVLLYFPFYIGFSSQAGGILPNLIYPTRGAHLWVMFAPFLIPIFAFLFYLLTINFNVHILLKAFKISLAFFLLLWFFSLFLGLAITITPQIGDFYQSTLASPGMNSLFSESLLRRINNAGGWLTMLILLSLTLGIFLKLEDNPQEGNGDQTISHPLSAQTSNQDFPPVLFFVLLLALWGALLVSAPEFVYLRDLFGWRINTIFKFYYQAWLYWSIAAAFSSLYLLAKLRRIWASIFWVILILTLGMALVYPTLSLWSKTNGFKPSLWTLDSSAYMQFNSPDEMEAIRWLQKAPFGVIAEAVPEGGGSYTQYGRAATLTGKPAVLGWVGHENQWRGKSEALGSRQDDLARLYCGRDWDITEEILNKYHIRYILIAPLERAAYATGSVTCPIGLFENKFERFLKPVFQQGAVVIYEYPGAE